MLEQLKLDPQTHIYIYVYIYIHIYTYKYLELVSLREHHQHTYVAICLSVFKKAKNGTLARKKNGATGLKLGMQTQLDSANNMGWVPSGHTSSFLCVRQKMPKMVLPKKKNHFNLITCSLLFKNLQHISSKQIFFVTTAHQR